MAYPYPGYQPYTYQYPQPVPDQLAQLRQQQMMQNPQQLPMQPQPVSQPMQMQDSRILVQGEMAAKAYLVANGNTVVLWDSEAPYVYLKTVDLSGVPSMRKLRITDETGQAAPQVEDKAPQIDLSDYESRLDDIEKRLEAVEKKRTPKQQKEAEET